MPLEILILIIIGFIWLFAGSQIVYWLVPNSGRITIVSLGAILGEIIYLFFININAYFFSNYTASLFSLIVLFIIGVFFFCLNGKNKLDIKWGMNRSYLIFFIAITTIMTGFYGVTFFFAQEINFDSYFHQPAAATIAEGNFPPSHPFNPDYSGQYHYGADLLASSFISLSGVKPWNAFNILALWNLLLAFITSFLIGWILSNKNFFSGLFASVFLFFGGSWKYISFIFNGESQIRHIDFQSGIADSYGISLFHNPTGLAVPIVLFIFYFLFFLMNFNGQSVKKIGILIINSVALAVLALVSEEMTVLLLISITAISALFFFQKNIWKKFLASTLPIVAVVVTACVLIVLQGGTLHDAFLGSQGTKIDHEITRFQLKLEPGFVFWTKDYGTGFMSFNNREWPLFLLKHFGPLPFIVPFLIFFLYRKIESNHRRFLFQLMAVMLFASFIIPIFIGYPTSEVDFARVFLSFKNIGNIFLGVAIGFLVSANFFRSKIWIVSGIIIITSYIFAPVYYNWLNLTTQLKNSPWGWSASPPYISKNDIQISSETKSLIPQKSRVLTSNIVTVMTLWGRFAPFAKSRQNISAYHPAFIRLFPKPSLADLQLLGIKYIYIAPFKEQIMYNNRPFKFLIKNIDNRYIENHPEWFTLMRKWSFNNEDYHLYGVANNQ